MDTTPAITRIVQRTTRDGDCWLWTGAKTGRGYGALRVDGKVQLAHRASYQAHVGPIPDGLVLDHLCRHRLCVNPAHLEPVTNRENILRGASLSAQYAAATHCIHGHEFTPENTRVKRSGQRLCRICDRAQKRAYRRRNLARSA